MFDLDCLIFPASSGTAYGCRQLDPPQWQQLAQDPAGLLWRNVDRPVKIAPESLIVEADLPLRTGPRRIAYKRYRPRNGWKAFCSLFRTARALRSWRLAQVLASRRIPTPLALFAYVPHRWRLMEPSYLATEWIEGGENLHLYGWRLAWYPNRERAARASRCAESLGRLIGLLHAAQIDHRDLKGANLMVVERGSDVRTFLVDLDGVRLRKRLAFRRRAANLARLAAGLSAHPWVTRSACCRFLRAYAAQFPSGAVEWKPLWRAVATRSGRLTRRKRRRAEPVL
ncbi:MAG: lipopolysaccharide kinase InaA family protein [Thermoguttaceae bacterium]